MKTVIYKDNRNNNHEINIKKTLQGYLAYTENHKRLSEKPSESLDYIIDKIEEEQRSKEIEYVLNNIKNLQKQELIAWATTKSQK